MRLRLVLLAVVAAACTPSDGASDTPRDDSAPSEASAQAEQRPPPVSVGIACDRAFKDAASVDDMHDTVEDLDPALRACKSVEEWVAAAKNHPGAMDVDPAVFLRNRCEFGGPDSELCRKVKETE